MHFTADDLVEMLWVHRAKDGREHEFSLSPATASRIRDLKNADGTSVWVSDPDLLLGFPVRLDPDIPDGEIRLECTTFPQDVTVYCEENTDD
jgi:HK97 family phage major capsid protein